MGDWDDEEDEDNLNAFGSANVMSTVPSAAEDEEFGSSGVAHHSAFDDEDEDSDDAADAWDASEEELEPEPEDGTSRAKSKKEAQVLAKAAKEAQQRAALREERMKLARRAGRFEAQEKAKAALSMKGVIGEDGVERRTDPSDGNNYTYAEFEEAYGPQAAELWVVAVQMMAEAAEKEAEESSGGDLGAVQRDSDALFGDDGDFYGDGDNSDEDEGSGGKKTLEACFMHQLVTSEEYTDAQDVLVNKFEQLLVSENFVGFFTKFCTELVKDQKTEAVDDVLSTVKRMQSGAKAVAKTKSAAPTAAAAAGGKKNPPLAAGGKKKSGKKNFKNITKGETNVKSGQEDMAAFM